MTPALAWQVATRILDANPDLTDRWLSRSSINPSGASLR